MKYFKLIIYVLFLLNLIQGNTCVLYGQSSDVIRYKADLFSNDYINGQTVRKLIGNVVFYQGNYTLKSNSGTFFQEKNRYIFDGEVQFYDGVKKLISDRVIYDDNLKTFYFNEGVKLIKDSRTITADKGIYYRNKKIAYCEGNVEYVDSLQTFTCGRAEYFEESEIIDAFDSLVYNNINENTTITGEKGKYSGEKDFIEITEKPVMVLKENGSEITVTSEKLEFINKLSKAVATGSVEILRENMTAKCNTAEYTSENGEEKIILKENPVIIQDESNIRGRQIELFLKNKNIYKLNVNEDAVVTMPADTTGSYDYKNKLMGKDINIFLNENKIEKMISERNAESIYFLFENGVSNGANKVRGERITLYFEDGIIRKVLVDGQSEGIFYPPDMVNELQK